MHRAHQLCPGVHWVGALDFDRRLFDSLIPLPDGTSYNACVVQGREKTALIDTVEPSRADEFFARLTSLGLLRLDLLIANHAEQDHSGLIPQVLPRHPGARVVTTPKGRRMLHELLRVPEEAIDAVEDGTVIDLGGRTLQLLHAPWMHWPETMLTCLPEEKILFSCDLFGSHLATHELLLDEVPADWVCPICGIGKEIFEPLED